MTTSTMLSLDRLTISTLTWTAAGTLAIYLLWKLYIYPEFFAPLRNIPGPPTSSYLVGNLLKVFGEESGSNHARWFAQYGPVIQYRGFGGENIISVSDPKTIQYMLMQKTSSFPKPKEEVRGLERMTGRGLLTVEGATHRRQARLLAPSFSQAQTETYLPTITEVADKLVKRIAEDVEKETSKMASKDPAGPIIDVCNWLSRATLDIISICGFEYPVGALDIEKHELVDAFNLMLRPIQLTVPIFLIIKTMNRLPFLSKLPVPMIKRAKASMALMQREAKNMMGGKLQEADNGELEGKDLISSIIRANKLATSEKDKLADDEIMGQIATFLLAGSETSSTALTWILHELSQRKDVQDKLRTEVRDAYKTIAVEGRSALTADELAGLKYLDAVIREGLRCDPPVALTVRETVEASVLPISQPMKGRDGQMITELVVPADQTISIDIMSVNKDKTIFGEDAGEFRPERWLENDGELTRKARSFTTWTPLLTFLGGPRGCTGYRLALLEIRVILARLVSEFEFSPSGRPITRRTNIVMRPIVEGHIEEGAQMPLKLRKVIN